MIVKPDSPATQEANYAAFLAAFHSRVKKENISGFYKLFYQSIPAGEVPRVVMDYYKNEVIQYDEDNYMLEADRLKIIATIEAFIFGANCSDDPDFSDWMRVLMELLKLVDLRLHPLSSREIEAAGKSISILDLLKAITDWPAIWLAWDTIVVTISKNEDLQSFRLFTDALKEYLLGDQTAVGGIIRRDFNE